MIGRPPPASRLDMRDRHQFRRLLQVESDRRSRGFLSGQDLPHLPAPHRPRQYCLVFAAAPVAAARHRRPDPPASHSNLYLHQLRL